MEKRSFLYSGRKGSPMGVFDIMVANKLQVITR